MSGSSRRRSASSFCVIVAGASPRPASFSSASSDASAGRMRPTRSDGSTVVEYLYLKTITLSTQSHTYGLSDVLKRRRSATDVRLTGTGPMPKIERDIPTNAGK